MNSAEKGVRVFEADGRDATALFLDLSEIALPAQAGSLFGRAGPLVLEIGFGNGSFLEYLGAAHPDWNILGADVSSPSVMRAFKRLRRSGLTNVRMYRGDGRFVVRDLLEDHSLSHVFVNFPDPWPRRRHRGRRLLDPSFFALLSAKLLLGGVVELTTDHEEYHDFACDSAAVAGGFRLESSRPGDPLLQTRYAMKWLKQSKSIYHVTFHNTVESAPHVAPIVRKRPMQHALMEGSVPTSVTFEREVHRTQEAHIVLMELLHDIEREGLVFTVLVEEAGLRQDILVEAIPHPRGVYVGVRRFAHPLATRGVGDAVKIVAGWLERRGLKLLDSWY